MYIYSIFYTIYTIFILYFCINLPFSVRRKSFAELASIKVFCLTADKALKSKKEETIRQEIRFFKSPNFLELSLPCMSGVKHRCYPAAPVSFVSVLPSLEKSAYALFFLRTSTAAAAARAITAAVPAIGAALSPVFTALLPEAVF